MKNDKIDELQELQEWLESEEGKRQIMESQEKSNAILKDIQESITVSPEKMREQFTI